MVVSNTITLINSESVFFAVYFDLLKKCQCEIKTIEIYEMIIIHCNENFQTVYYARRKL